MPLTYVVALLVGISLLATLAFALVMRRGKTIAAIRRLEDDSATLRQANADFERRFTLEQEKSARLAEEALAQRVRGAGLLSDAKAAAEGQLATAAEVLRRVEAAHRETRERLESSECNPHAVFR